MPLAIELPVDYTPEQRDTFIDAELTKLAEEDVKIPAVPEKPEQDGSVDDSTAGASAAETGDEGQAEADRSWLDDEAKDLAKSLGYEEGDLAEFQTKEDLDRFLSVAEKRAYRDRMKQSAPAEVKPEAVKAADPPKTEPSKSDAAEYKVTLDPDTYDEGLVQEIKQLNDHYAGKMAKLEERLARYEKGQQQSSFDAIVAQFEPVADSLEAPPDLFGKTHQESQAQLTNRNRLLIAIGQVANLRGIPLRTALSDQALVSRALHLEFGDALIKQERTKVIEKVKKQSSQRLGIGKQRTGLEPFQGDLEDDPELDKLWTKLQKNQ